MLSVHFEPFPIINTGRLVLREIYKADVNEIFLLRSDPRVLKYLDREPAASVDEVLLHIEKLQELKKNNESIIWAITQKENTRLIGTICFWNILKEHYRAEIGYTLLYDFHRKGIMQEALSAVIKYGFETMKLHSIEATVNPANTSSIKLLERNNFVREGYFKENYFYDGKFLDSAVYSLITDINDK